MGLKKSKSRPKKRTKKNVVLKRITNIWTKHLPEAWTVVRKRLKRFSQFQLTVIATVLCLAAIVGVSIVVVSFRPTIKYNTQHMSPEMTEIISQYREINPLPLNQRIVRWSAFVKKNPKLLPAVSNLSRTIANDNVPYVPNDFDCTTYVETIAALARAAHPDMVDDELTAIRYKDGDPSFLNRNHFPEADWIPNNASAGLLRDTTTQIAHRAEKEPSFASKTIYKGEWLQTQIKRQGRSLASVTTTAPSAPAAPAAAAQTKEVSLAYIPLSDVEELLPHIPSGSVINMVHEDAPGKPVLISHQGILIKTKRGAYLRHARARSGIRDQLLLPYLQSQSDRSWQVVGININEFIE